MIYYLMLSLKTGKSMDLGHGITKMEMRVLEVSERTTNF